MFPWQMKSTDRGIPPLRTAARALRRRAECNIRSGKCLSHLRNRIFVPILQQMSWVYNSLTPFATPKTDEGGAKIVGIGYITAVAIDVRGARHTLIVA